MNYEYGVGPHSTPLLVYDMLYTVGATGKLFALDKKTESRSLTISGKTTAAERWRSRLLCSPLAYKNTIILTLGGGQNQTLIAFNQKDGTTWKNQSLDMSPSSPIIINVDGQEQLVAFLGKVVAGIDP